MLSINTIAFNNDFVGLRRFYLDDGEYAKNMSDKIISIFGFRDSDDYIDYMPDGGYLDREPFIRIVTQEPPFTTIAYADSKELPYNEHTLLFTFKEIRIDVHMRHISSSNTNTVDFNVISSINSTLGDELENGHMFLLRPGREYIQNSLPGVTFDEDDLWFCSDWKG